MRLKEYDIQVITEAVRRQFGPEAEVRLFGSRVSDELRGGDIDLYVITTMSGEPLQSARFYAMSEIQRRLGDQKIDIVTRHPDQSPRDSLVWRKAEQNGIPLSTPIIEDI